MSLKQLTLATVLLVIALTPSIADVAQAHTEKPHLLPLLWGWLALAAVVAVLAGEQLRGGA